MISLKVFGLSAVLAILLSTSDARPAALDSRSPIVILPGNPEPSLTVPDVDKQNLHILRKSARDLEIKLFVDGIDGPPGEEKEGWQQKRTPELVVIVGSGTSPALPTDTEGPKLRIL